jgi:transposase
MLWGSGKGMAPSALFNGYRWSSPMSQQHFDANRSLTALEQNSTIIAVIEMSQSKWLVASLVPGVERQPLKKLDAQEEGLLKLLHRWRTEAGQAGRAIKRIVVAYEAGRDGFWLARWLRGPRFQSDYVKALQEQPANEALSPVLPENHIRA